MQATKSLPSFATHSFVCSHSWICQIFHVRFYDYHGAISYQYYIYHVSHLDSRSWTLILPPVIIWTHFGLYRAANAIVALGKKGAKHCDITTEATCANDLSLKTEGDWPEENKETSEASNQKDEETMCVSGTYNVTLSFRAHCLASLICLVCTYIIRWLLNTEALFPSRMFCSFPSLAHCFILTRNNSLLCKISYLPKYAFYIF